MEHERPFNFNFRRLKAEQVRANKVIILKSLKHRVGSEVAAFIEAKGFDDFKLYWGNTESNSNPSVHER
jgi:hypothetical protein